VWVVVAFVAGLLVPILACAGSIALAVTLSPEGAEGLPIVIGSVWALGALGLPLAWHAARRLRGDTPGLWRTPWWWIVAAGLLIVLLLTGGQIAVTLDLAPTFVIAILQPLLFVAAAAGLLTLTAGGWMGMSPLRAWASFASGAWFATLGGFLVEIAAIGLVGFIALVIVVAVDPTQAEQIMRIAESMSEGIIDLDAIAPLALQPWVFGVALFVFAVIAPLIEEFFKSAGVIFLLSRRPGPMAAYISGVMGGLGFAIAETLGYLSAYSEAWAVNVLLRLATLVMHAFTAGLVGWGWGQLADGRPMRFVGAYLGAVALHGLWNGIAVANAFGSLYLVQNPNPTSPTVAVIGLIILASVLVMLALIPACVVGLASIGYRLRTSEGQSTTAASPPTQTSAEPASAASATAGE
jgi:hypothetical protein